MAAKYVSDAQLHAASTLMPGDFDQLRASLIELQGLTGDAQEIPEQYEDCLVLHDKLSKQLEKSLSE